MSSNRQAHIAYVNTPDGILAEVDGVSVGTFPTLEDAEREAHEHAHKVEAYGSDGGYPTD